MKRHPIGYKVAYFVVIAILTVACRALAVDVQSPVGDWICRVVEDRGDDRDTDIEISFGHLDVSSEDTFIEVAKPPFIEFSKDGMYPLETVCWSPKGQYCMVVFVDRKWFSVQIIDVTGRKIKTTGVEVDEQLKAKLDSLKLNGGLMGRWLRSAHWAGEDKLVLLAEDGTYDEKFPTVRYELDVVRKDGDWTSSIAKTEVKTAKGK